MYQLGYGLQEASICLRCQYRLSLRKYYRPDPRRTFQQNRHFALGRPFNQKHASVVDINNADNQDDVLTRPYNSHQVPSGAKNVDYHQDTQSEPNIRYEVYEGPTAALVSRKTRGFPQMKESLGYNRLGQPAEVLILREGHRKREEDIISNERGTPRSKPLLTEAMSSSDMLGEIDAERGIISKDQVVRNIDALMNESLRELTAVWQTTGTVVPVEKYDKIASRLYEGFTASQLAAYLAYTARTYPVDPLDLHNKFSTSLYTRSPWTPGASDVWRIKPPGFTGIGTDGSLKSRGARETSEIRGPHKASLVDEIMRRCWRMRPEEDESALGEMEMQLQSAHLELIVNHKRGILKQISETYGARVEASTRDRALRITSDYETCVDILRLIIQTLGSIKSYEVDFPVESRPNLQSSSPHMNKYETFIREIMQSTNIIIKAVTPLGRKVRKGQSKALSRLMIYYLGPDDEDMEDARRLISQILRTDKPKNRAVVVGRAIREKRDLLVPIDVGSGLSLTDRSQQWSRWCSRSMRGIDPKSKQQGAVSHPNTIENPLDQQEIVRALNRFFALTAKEYETVQKTESHWVNSVIYWDSAMLGQVVFPTPNSKAETASLKPGNRNPGLQPRLDSIYREFVTLVPGLVGSLESIGMEDPVTKTLNEESLLIRLFPSSKNALPATLLEAVPDLEIRISCDEETKTTSIRDVRLVFKKELDLLLPQNTLDLRFVRQRCVYARSGSGLDPSIKRFIQDSNLDIWGLIRLKTPTDLTLCIPPHALGPVGEGLTTAGFENHDIQYTFASLEHKNEIGIPFKQPDSWADLTYTTIEAGKIGGRRDELCLRQARRPKRASQTDNDDGHDGEQGVKFVDVDDEQYSASLLRKANALIKRLESPPDQGGGRIEDGVEREARESIDEGKKEKMKKREEAAGTVEALTRSLIGVDKAGSRRDVARRVASKIVRRV